MIVEYKIITGKYLEDLRRNVETELAQGYQPWGPAQQTTDHENAFFQVMVKEGSRVF